MVKLVRLSTTDDLGVFKCNFDTDVLLNENATLALRNIVFEPDRIAFIMNRENGKIITKPIASDDNTNFSTAFVEGGRYTMSNFQRCLQEVSNALNRTLAISPSFSNDRSDVFSSYRLREDPEEAPKLEIIYRLSPVCPPRLDTGRFWELSPSPYDTIESVIVASADTLQLKIGTAGVGDERYRAVAREGIGLNKGNAIYYIQIRNSTVSVPPENNGFGIGLTLQLKDDLPTATDTTNPRMDDQVQHTSIRPTAKNFEIQFQDMNTNYKFRSGGLKSSPDLTTSAFTPQNGSAATTTKNDILMIQVTTNTNLQKVITGHVVQEDSTDVGKNPVTVVTRNLFEYVLNDEDIGNEFGDVDNPTNNKKVIFTPYLFIRGGIGNIIVQHLRFTPDVCVDMEEVLGTGIRNDIGYFPLEDDHPLDIAEGFINAGFVSHIPQVPVPEHRIELLQQETTSRVTLSNELGDFLGMGVANRDPNDEDYFFGDMEIDLQEDRVLAYDDGDVGIMGAVFRFIQEPSYATRDFYLIESINLNLDSFNSMVGNKNTEKSTNGERRNILDTIPDPNLGMGVVEYIPNELVYVNIKNSSNVNLRNVAFRILDDDLNPVSTYGQSNMTVIIKD